MPPCREGPGSKFTSRVAFEKCNESYVCTRMSTSLRNAEFYRRQLKRRLLSVSQCHNRDLWDLRRAHVGHACPGGNRNNRAKGKWKAPVDAHDTLGNEHAA